MLSRRLILPAVAAMALAFPAAASAVVNGDSTGDGDHPALAFVGADTNGVGGTDRYCAGTLVGSRQVLTAARCATYGPFSVPLPEAGFEVRLGDVELATATEYPVADNEVHEAYDATTGSNDVAMLTLAQPVAYPPVRVIVADETETAAWTPGTAALVAGWGETESGFLSPILRTGDVTIRPDADCSNGMLCAAGPPADNENPCAGDSGSPLLVADGPGFALAGVFSGATCGSNANPGRFARVGDDPLNAWVHERTPEADFDLSHQPRVGEPVALMSTSRHPKGDDYFTTFRWDLNDDGVFGDATGASISHTYTQVGEAVAGLEASKPGGDKAMVYYSFDVEPSPTAIPPATPPKTRGPLTANPVATSPLATVLASGRPRVRRGRFAIRVHFARTAPRGTAVIEVYRGRRRIGIGRTRVRRGAIKRVNVKLTPTGRRLLRRAKSGRLRVRVRVRVGRRVLRTRQLTIRR